MRKVYFSLIMTFGILCLGPGVAQSQEDSNAVPTDSIQPVPTGEVEQVDVDNSEDVAVPEPEALDDSKPVEQSEEALDNSEPVEQSEEAPEGEVEQAEESTQAINELYTQLEQYLADQATWREADQTTYELMLLIAGAQSQELGYFDSAEWEDFPCEEFQRIDSLWGSASQGQQGFTSQLTIFREVERNTFEYFQRIGWQQNGTWTVRWEYNEGNKRVSYLDNMQPNFVDPPAGHLPALMQWSRGADYRLAKAATCLAQ